MSKAKFDVDFFQSIKGATDLVNQVGKVGTSLDSLQGDAKKVAQNVAKDIGRISAVYDKLIESAEKAVKPNKAYIESLQTLKFTAESSFIAIAAANQKADTAARAYLDTNSKLNQVLRDTDAKTRTANALKAINGATHSLSLENDVLIAKIKALDSAEGKRNAVLRAQRSALKAVQEEDQKRLISAAATRREIEYLSSAQGKADALAKAELATKRQLVLEDQKRAESTSRLRREIAYLASAEGKANAALQVQLRAQRQALMSNAEAHSARGKRIRLATQATAAMRAGLHGMQASIGMYTSSTIIAASATYGLVRAIRSTIVVGAEFQATMARTQAIMGGGFSAELSNDMFANMERRIRALGMSTQFTASEVALAMTELGQAGLSAGQAMTALEPTLNLAIIGGIDMAKSADHATNIMMIFGKEASDLTNIVDVMAKAVTSSNTNIDQLANALTYAGPAAETLGITMQETTTAIAALANAGFKSSRSGTAMRRLFVNLAAPTKKGQEVLDRFGVTVTDVHGKTRSLNAILKDLRKGLDSVSEAEQLGSIKDLVGVYAASPVAALLSQDEAGFDFMVQQMTYVEGTAKDMKEQIENALKFDFRTALSAFQDAQLQVFDKLEGRLQMLTISTAKWLTDLSQPFEGTESSDGVTNLDVYLERASTLASSVGIVIGAMVALKIASADTGLRAYAVDASKAAAANKLKARSLKEASIAQAEMNVYLQGASLRTKVVTTATNLYTKSLQVMTKAMHLAGAAAAFLSRWVGRILSVVSWAGIIYAAYEALSLFVGDKVVNKVKAKNAALKDLSESYLEVKNSIQAVAQAESRAAATDQLDILLKHRANMVKARAEWESASENLKKSGGSTDRAEAEIAGLTYQIKETDKAILDARKRAEGGILVGILKDIEKVRILNDLMAIAQGDSSRYHQRRSEIRVAREEGQDTSLSKEAREFLEEYRGKPLSELEEALQSIVSKSTSAARGVSAIFEAVDTSLARNKLEREATSLVASFTDFDLYILDLERLKIAEKNYLESREELKIAREKGLTPSRIEGENLETLAKLWDDAKSKANSYFNNKKNESFAEAQFRQKLEFEFLNKTEAQREASLRSEYRTIQRYTAELVKQEAEAKEDSIEKAVLQHNLVRLKDEELELLKKIKALDSKKGGSNTKDNLDAEWAAYQKLAREIDPVLWAKKDLLKIEEQLARLRTQEARDKGKHITSEQEMNALIQARKNLVEFTNANDKSLQSWMRLQESYRSSPFQKSVEDLVSINRLIKEAEEAYGAASPGSVAKTDAYMEWMDREEIREKLLEKENRTIDFSSISPQQGLGEGTLSSILDYNKGQQDFKFQQLGQEDAYYSTSRNIDEKQRRESQDQRNIYDPMILDYEQQGNTEAMLAAEDKLQEQLTRIKEEGLAAREAAQLRHNSAIAELAERSAEQQRQSGWLVVASAAQDMSNMLMMISDATDEFNSGQKAAFIAAKALAVANIIISTEVAAARAPAEAGTFLGMSLATLIRSQGYASAGLVTAMSIGEYGRKSSASKSSGDNYAGAYDKGGYIPTGQYGIVGEYGPEIVNGPAHVTGREATARKLSGGGDTNISAPVTITYNADSGASNEDKEKDAKMMGEAVRLAVLKTLQTEMRPNGILYKR